MRLGMLLLTAALLSASAAAEDAEVVDRAEELTRRTYCVRTVSGSLLAAGTSYGLVLYRLDDRGFPARAGALLLEDAVTDLASTGDLVFAANGPRGLVVVDTADPDAPKEVARVETPGAILRLLLLGTSLYAAMGTMGVGRFDVTDPKQPVLAARIEIDGTCRDLALGPGGLLAAGARLARVRRPEAASSQVEYSGAGEAGAVAVQGQALVAGGSAFFRVDDAGVAAPGSAPVVLADTIRDLEPFPGGVAVAAGSDGLVLLAFDGQRDSVVARMDPGGACTRVHARGTRLFATADAAGFAVYDVRDLANPVKVFPTD